MVETEIQSMTREEFARFRVWLAEYEADQWDRQIEADILAGKLDALAEEARRDHAAGRSFKMPSKEPTAI